MSLGGFPSRAGEQGALPASPHQWDAPAALGSQASLIFFILMFNYNHWDWNQSFSWPSMNINKTLGHGFPG